MDKLKNILSSSQSKADKVEGTTDAGDFTNKNKLTGEGSHFGAGRTDPTSHMPGAYEADDAATTASVASGVPGKTQTPNPLTSATTTQEPVRETGTSGPQEPPVLDTSKVGTQDPATSTTGPQEPALDIRKSGPEDPATIGTAVTSGSGNATAAATDNVSDPTETSTEPSHVGRDTTTGAGVGAGVGTAAASTFPGETEQEADPLGADSGRSFPLVQEGARTSTSDTTTSYPPGQIGTYPPGGATTGGATTTTTKDTPVPDLSSKAETQPTIGVGAGEAAGGLVTNPILESSSAPAPQAPTLTEHSGAKDPVIPTTTNTYDSPAVTEQTATSGPVEPHRSEWLNKVDPRINPDPAKRVTPVSESTATPATTEHHDGRDAAAAGVGAAGGVGAYEAVKHHGATPEKGEQITTPSAAGTSVTETQPRVQERLAGSGHQPQVDKTPSAIPPTDVTTGSGLGTERDLKSTYTPSGTSNDLKKTTYTPSGTADDLKTTYTPSGPSGTVSDLKTTYTPSSEKRYEREAAVGAGAAGVGAAGVGYEADKKSSAVDPLDDTTRATPVPAHSSRETYPTGASAAPEDNLKATYEPTKEKHHGRDAAVGAGVGAGAAGVAYEADKKASAVDPLDNTKPAAATPAPLATPEKSLTSTYEPTREKRETAVGAGSKSTADETERKPSLIESIKNKFKSHSDESDSAKTKTESHPHRDAEVAGGAGVATGTAVGAYEAGKEPSVVDRSATQARAPSVAHPSQGGYPTGAFPDQSEGAKLNNESRPNREAAFVGGAGVGTGAAAVNPLESKSEVPSQTHPSQGGYPGGALPDRSANTQAESDHKPVRDAAVAGGAGAATGAIAEHELSEGEAKKLEKEHVKEQKAVEKQEAKEHAKEQKAVEKQEAKEHAKEQKAHEKAVEKEEMQAAKEQKALEKQESKEEKKHSGILGLFKRDKRDDEATSDTKETPHQSTAAAIEPEHSSRANDGLDKKDVAAGAAAVGAGGTAAGVAAHGHGPTPRYDEGAMGPSSDASHVAGLEDSAISSGTGVAGPASGSRNDPRTVASETTTGGPTTSTAPVESTSPYTQEKGSTATPTTKDTVTDTAYDRPTGTVAADHTQPTTTSTAPVTQDPVKSTDPTTAPTTSDQATGESGSGSGFGPSTTHDAYGSADTGPNKLHKGPPQKVLDQRGAI